MLAAFTSSLHAQTFQNIPALSFTKMLDSTSNPLPQVLTVASTGANFNFYTTIVSGTGGNWLTTSASTYQSASTPNAISVTVAPATSLAAGTYTAHISLKASGSTTSFAIAVTLTVEPTSSTYFDELPGAYTFSMATQGSAPPSQILFIRNAGAGTLNWTATTSTADGGHWLTLSATSGARLHQYLL